jgi:hypothetical protein
VLRPPACTTAPVSADSTALPPREHPLQGADQRPPQRRMAPVGGRKRRLRAAPGRKPGRHCRPRRLPDAEGPRLCEGNVATDVAAPDVAEAITTAVRAFREAAGDDATGWDMAAATAEVRPESFGLLALLPCGKHHRVHWTAQPERIEIAAPHHRSQSASCLIAGVEHWGGSNASDRDRVPTRRRPTPGVSQARKASA